MAITGFRKALLILLLAVAGGGTILWAQSPALPASAVMTASPASEVDAGAVRLLVGRSSVLDVGTAITRVSLTSSDIADVMVTSPGQLLINGKMPGTISMFVWDKAGSLRRYEVIVQRDLARLSEQLRELFPGETIEVRSNGKNVVLSGLVSSKDVIEKATNVAAGYVGAKEEVVALLQLQPNAPSNQVLLRVRFAEVSRSAITELGASLFTSPIGVENTIGRITTQQFPAPGFEKLEWSKASSDFGADVTSASGQFTFGDFLNLFLFSQKYDLGLMVKALQQRGLFQSLAEPNLVAESGKEASFLAGGEFPIPVAQGSGANLAISVVFKEFGVRLNFTPTVTGDRIHLKVRPEVSTIDFNNAVVLQGFRIPALSTRRIETELELANGQTFAIAGLMNNQVSSTMSKVPGIGDIPILGYLFRSKAAQKNQTELVVMITPIILPNNSTGVTPNMPRTPEPYLPALPDTRTLPSPPPAYGGAPGANARPTSAPAANSRSETVPSATTAAAAVTALAPAPPRIAEPAAPAVSAAPAPAASASTASSAPAERPLTSEEKRTIERVRRQEQEKVQAQEQAELRARAIEGRRLAVQQEEEKRKAAKDQERQQELAREQARRDAEAARRSQEAARQQAERDREQQKLVDEAAARLKAAEALYNAEVAKKNKR